jgi:hypothetical protein
MLVGLCTLFNDDRLARIGVEYLNSQMLFPLGTDEYDRFLDLSTTFKSSVQYDLMIQFVPPPPLNSVLESENPGKTFGKIPGFYEPR